MSQNKVVAEIQGIQSREIASTPDGTRLDVAGNGKDTVSVFDTSTNTIIATVRVIRPGGVAINSAGSRAYVTSSVLFSVKVRFDITDDIIRIYDERVKALRSNETE